ncbi:MAG TPA: hypothetical protein VNN17_00055 [Terriglobia bacterium]|nr:hypothetical protein [Terriglobia bacterium]
MQKRPPLRVIRDPYPAFSSVAVDPVRDEVVFTDENLFQVMVYDRMANTPPGAAMTEPKRVIGGLKTKIEFNCDVYVDPKTGDIYTISHDSEGMPLTIFDRQASGDVAPSREMDVPKGTYGVAVDEEAEEIFLSIQHDSAVVVFKKYGERDDPPIRLLQGDKTLLGDAHGIALDTRKGEMFVSNYGYSSSRGQAQADRGGRRGQAKPNWPLQRDVAIPGTGKMLPPSINVYPLKAHGDIPPLRMIQGPKTQLNMPSHLFMDEQHGELYVANDMGNSILVFDAAANGDVAPKRVLKGPRTLIQNPTGLDVDLKNDELWVANFGTHAATVFKRTAEGDTPPLRVIRNGPVGAPSLMIGNPGAVGYDSKREEILVPNCVMHPQIAIFPRLADGAAVPSRQIHGQRTLLSRTVHAIAYDDIHDEIVVPNQFAQAILTFRGGATGEEPPIRIIHGSRTGLQEPDRLGIDAVNGEIYVPQYNKLLVYPRQANGNVAPSRILETKNGMGGAVAIDAVRNLIVTAGSRSIQIFPRQGNGMIEPVRVIGGPKSSEAIDGSRNIAVYAPKGWIIVANQGINRHRPLDYSEESFVGVWSIYDEGDVLPRWRIGGPFGALRQARGVALDPKNKSLIVSDKYLNAALTFYFPEIF